MTTAPNLVDVYETRKLAICLLSAATLIGPAWPAWADANPTPTLGTSVSDSRDKSATATCDPGQQVYGAGGRINRGYGNVVLDEYVPSDNLSSVTARGLEHGAYPGDWSVSAWAICGPPTANQQRVFFETPRDSTSPKHAVAACPPNLRLYGVGGEIVDGRGGVTLDGAHIDAGLTRASIGAHEIGDHSADWSLLGYAICANPATTMIRVTASSGTQDGGSPKHTATVACPDGTALRGVGGEISGGAGAVLLDDIDATAKGYEVGGSSGATWNIVAYGVCSS